MYKATATVCNTTAAVTVRTRFINIKRFPVKVPPIEGVDCFLGFGFIGHLDEPETSGLAGVAVSHDLDLSNGAVRFKERTDRLFIRPEN